MSAFDALFVSQIVSYALEIARLQRGENHLQSRETLLAKYQAEKRELAEAANIWDEIPDVVYYATCLLAWGEAGAFLDMKADVLPLYEVSHKQAKAACLAKYARRANGEPKNIEAERAAIMAALKGV